MTCVVLSFSMHCKVINIWANIKYKDALLNVFCVLLCTKHRESDIISIYNT